MKQYHILQTFNGSQDGRFAETFREGTQAALSDYLAEIALREGWVAPIDAPPAAEKPAPVIENKAVVANGEHHFTKRSRK